MTGAEEQTVVALRDLVIVLNEIAETIDQILERAESFLEKRTLGESWIEIVTELPRPSVVELLTTSVEDLHISGGRFRRAHAKALRAEGLTIRQIAECFGVTHQRVSALIRNEDPPTGSLGSYRRLPKTGYQRPEVPRDKG